MTDLRDRFEAKVTVTHKGLQLVGRFEDRVVVLGAAGLGPRCELSWRPQRLAFPDGPVGARERECSATTAAACTGVELPPVATHARGLQGDQSLHFDVC